MKINGRKERLGFALVIVLILMLQSPMGFAGEENRLAQFVYRYDVLKANATTILGSLRRARLDGQLTNDRRPLLHLRKEVMDFCFEVRKYLHAQRTTGLATPVAFEDRTNALAIAYSCEAMEQVLEAEFDVHQNGDQNPKLLLQIQEKYEEVWKTADELVSGSHHSMSTEKR
jgi:hypothetical protein